MHLKFLRGCGSKRNCSTRWWHYNFLDYHNKNYFFLFLSQIRRICSFTRLRVKIASIPERATSRAYLGARSDVNCQGLGLSFFRVFGDSSDQQKISLFSHLIIRFFRVSSPSHRRRRDDDDRRLYTDFNVVESPSMRKMSPDILCFSWIICCSYT